MSKRRRGFPSESQVKRGVRIVNGDKLLILLAVKAADINAEDVKRFKLKIGDVRSAN